MTPQEYRAARQLLGSQNFVARQLGVHPSSVRRRELNTRPITREAELALIGLASIMPVLRPPPAKGKCSARQMAKLRAQEQAKAPPVPLPSQIIPAAPAAAFLPAEPAEPSGETYSATSDQPKPAPLPVLAVTAYQRRPSSAVVLKPGMRRHRTG